MDSLSILNLPANTEQLNWACEQLVFLDFP